MSLRRTFILAFAAVAVVVAALVGAASYAATAHNLISQVDESLAQAANTFAAGGVLPAVPARPGRGRDQSGHDDGMPVSSRLIVQASQLVTPDGTTVPTTGVSLPVDASDLALAAAGQPGLRRFQERAVGPDSYRVLTQSTGSGAVMVGRDIDELDGVLAELAVQIGAIGLIVAVAAALAGWVLARRITRRLLQLAETAEQISVTGRLDLAMPGHGRDEVGRLSATLDTMLGELARSRDDQQRLVQDAGHELRTPLTSLRTNISVLRRFSELGPEARRRLLDDVDGETRELTSLVNELVELATDRRADEQPGPVDLADLAQRAAARARRRSGRTITVHAEHAVIDGRPQALERAVSNLLDNALKFDPDPGQPVELHADASRIEVRDHGPGVAAADAARVFDRFYRATAARSLPGSGLGLAIVRDVADLHGGHPYVTDRPGGGAVVGFTLGAAPESGA